MKNRVMHYYTDPNSIGGPNTYIQTICNSKLEEEYDFSCCYQMKAVNRLRIADFKRIVKEIKDFKPDILHIHGIQGEGLVGAICGKLAHCPAVLMTVHGMQNDSITNGKKKNWLYAHCVENIALRLCSHVYCVCKATEDSAFIQKNAKNLLPFVWNCVNEMPVYDRRTERENLGIKDGDFMIISVGRVTVMKGYEVLAKVIKKDKAKENRYVIVGNGPYLSVMKKELSEEEKMGKVIFAGQQKEVGKYLTAADLYVTATYKENLSISILEAGAYGLPCVVTDVGGNPEIICDDVTGRVVPIREEQKMLKVITELSTDSLRCQHYGQALQKRVETEFSKAEFIKRIKQVYSGIIGVGNDGQTK